MLVPLGADEWFSVLGSLARNISREDSDVNREAKRSCATQYRNCS